MSTGKWVALTLSIVCLLFSAIVWWRHHSAERQRTVTKASRESPPSGPQVGQQPQGPTGPMPVVSNENQRSPTENLVPTIVDKVASSLRSSPGLESVLFALRAIVDLDGVPKKGAEREKILRQLLTAMQDNPAILELVEEIARGRETGAIRRLAIIALGRVKDNSACEVLWELAQSADGSTRQQAILSLSQGGLDPYAAWTDESLNKLGAVRATSINLFPAKTAEGFLSLLKAEQDPEVASILVTVLGPMLPEPRSQRQRSNDEGYKALPLLESLSETAKTYPSPSVRVNAVFGLSNSMHPEAISTLVYLAERDPHVTVRRAALRSLPIQPYNEPSQSARERILLAESDPQLVTAALTGLRLTQPNGAERVELARRVEVVYSNSESPDTRMAVLRVWMHGGYRYQSLLRDASLRDPSSAVRSAASSIIDQLERAQKQDK